MFLNYGTTGVPWAGIPPDLARMFVQDPAPSKPKEAKKTTKKAFDYRAYQLGPNAPDPVAWFAQGWRK